MEVGFRPEMRGLNWKHDRDLGFLIGASWALEVTMFVRDWGRNADVHQKYWPC